MKGVSVLHRGIDVSEAQGNINWQNVESSNVKFAMIRATYGISGIDLQFENNMEKISETNIYTGVYHQSNANNSNEAILEARHFLNTIRKYAKYISYPLALNMESEFAMSVSKVFFTETVNSFFKVIKGFGVPVVLYAKPELINKYLNMKKLEKVGIWLADLTTDILRGPSYLDNVIMWQYSQKGKVGGIYGNVNLDISYIDHSKKINIGVDGMMQQNMTLDEDKNLEPDFLEPVFYTVQNGDTLRSISKKILGNEDDYRKLMELNNITRPIVFAGQTLRVPPSGDTNHVLYRVKAGDTLWKISKKFLNSGPRYTEIMDDNGLTNDMIFPGQVLRIYISDSDEYFYTVKKGDTLWNIAKTYLGDGNRYVQIMHLNNLKNGNIKIGQILKMPGK